MQQSSTLNTKSHTHVIVKDVIVTVTTVTTLSIARMAAEKMQQDYKASVDDTAGLQSECRRYSRITQWEKRAIPLGIPCLRVQPPLSIVSFQTDLGLAFKFRSGLGFAR